MSIYFFGWEGPSIKDVRSWWGMEGTGHPKCVQLRAGTEGHVYVYARTYTIFFMFSEAFLSYSFLFYL